MAHVRAAPVAHRGGVLADAGRLGAATAGRRARRQPGADAGAADGRGRGGSGHGGRHRTTCSGSPTSPTHWHPSTATSAPRCDTSGPRPGWTTTHRRHSRNPAGHEPTPCHWPPPGSPSWSCSERHRHPAAAAGPELATRIGADAVIAEASIGVFPVPPEVSAVDKQVVPGHRADRGAGPRAEAAGRMVQLHGQLHRRVVVRRTGAPGSVRADGVARPGRWPHRRQPGHPAAHRWLVHRRAARTVQRRRRPGAGRSTSNGGWSRSRYRCRPHPSRCCPMPPVRARGGSARRSAAGRLPAELTGALTTAVELELASAPAVSARARPTSRWRVGSDDRSSRRLRPGRGGGRAEARRPGRARRATPRGPGAGLGAPALWQATRVRPLAAAVGRLDPGLREYDRLGTLTDGSPLPRTLRALVRRPEIAPAYAMDVVARAVRAAMGELVGDDVLARSVAHRPSTELVCALAIATTCAASTKDELGSGARGEEDRGSRLSRQRPVRRARAVAARTGRGGRSRRARGVVLAAHRRARPARPGGTARTRAAGPRSGAAHTPERASATRSRSPTRADRAYTFTR